ncbi:MAG: transglutaminase [Actinobacteria bacterium HGW-Actinobacteria-2]|nr:MAG: transglutaminase [Actinobacteria bacterium HGW-Actinobacteria-2]
MKLRALSPSQYLGSDVVIESDSSSVIELATCLLPADADEVAFAQAAFEWVRDQVAHSVDAGDHRITLSATEVIAERVGLCFSKAHLLVALLRSRNIPAGLCYQRLRNGDGFVLHGLVAVHLDGTWHRLDPRGNNRVVDAQFDLDTERVAWQADPSVGEIDYTEVWTAAAPLVVDALTGAQDALALCAGGLPDRPA